MDERKAYWFEQPYMPRMKNIAVAPVILEDGRLSFCVPGDDGPPWSGVWNLTGKIVLDGDDYIYESIGHLVGWCFFRFIGNCSYGALLNERCPPVGGHTKRTVVV